jgi:hypothetical protein
MCGCDLVGYFPSRRVVGSTDRMASILNQIYKHLELKSTRAVLNHQHVVVGEGMVVKGISPGDVLPAGFRAQIDARRGF